MSYFTAKIRYTKFDFGWGYPPDPAGAAYSAPTCHIAGFKGPTSKGKEGRAKEEGEGVKGVPDLKMEKVATLGVPIQEGRSWHPMAPRRDVNYGGRSRSEPVLKRF